MTDLSMRGPLGQKTQNMVAPAIRKSAEGEDCTLRLSRCTYDPAQTIFAHLRFFGWAGMSQKPDDLLGVYTCKNCHDDLDNRASGTWGFEDVLRALGETLMRMKAKGLIYVKGVKQ